MCSHICDVYKYKELVFGSSQVLVEAGTKMRLNISISYFSVAMIKYRDQSKLRKKEFILPHILWGYSPIR